MTTKELIKTYGRQIPYGEWTDVKQFVELREQGYVPVHDAKLMIKS